MSRICCWEWRSSRAAVADSRDAAAISLADWAAAAVGIRNVTPPAATWAVVEPWAWKVTWPPNRAAVCARIAFARGRRESLRWGM